MIWLMQRRRLKFFSYYFNERLNYIMSLSYKKKSYCLLYAGCRLILVLIDKWIEYLALATLAIRMYHYTYSILLGCFGFF